jgi:putative ABC transport system permease protein
MLTDLRYAFRGFRRDPGFTATAVITLALGIGASIAVYSLVRAVLLAPLPVPEADRLVSIAERRPGSRDTNIPVSGHEFVAWQEQNHVFERIALFRPETANLTSAGEPESIMIGRVSPGFFPLLRLPAALGRVFEERDDRAGADPVAILSDAFWRRRFGADPGVLATRLTLNDRTYTVIGVMRSLPPTLTTDVWLPIDVAGQARAVGRHNLNVIARLSEGVTLEQAQADLDTIAARLTKEYPAENTDHHVRIEPFRESLVGEFRLALLLLFAAVGFVLLIACGNVANLLLARTAHRQREIAIRTALGATRLRVLRQLLVEGVALGAMGGTAGLLIAIWIVELAAGLTAIRIPLLETARLDWYVLTLAAGVSIATGAMAGLPTALRGTRIHAAALRESRGTSDARGTRLRSTLVACEVALTLMLLVGAGLMTNSFVRLITVNPGFRIERVLVLPVDLPGPRYPEAHQRRAFVERLLARLQSTAGIEAAGAISHLPLGGADNWMPFQIQGRPAPAPGQELYAAFRVVTPDYFRTLEIPLRRGRFFSDSDARRAVPIVRWFPQQPNPPGFDDPQAAPTAIISEAAARQHWPDEDPVGKRIRVLFSADVTIVGIVGDIKHNALNQPSHPHVYLSHNQEPWNSLSVVVRTTGTPLSAAAAVREQVRALDPVLPVSMREMDDVRAASVGRPRFFVLLIVGFGAMALGLAVVGIFGVVSYLAAQRTREIGVRMALGARRDEILRLVIGHGMRPIAVGIAAGIAGAAALTRFIETLLFDVKPADPATFMAAATLLAAMALLACWVPARRAANVDPVIALRAE